MKDLLSNNMDIRKEVIIEYIENIYALSINYLKDHKNLELKNLLKELELIEDKIRICDTIKVLNNYENIFNYLINRIEDIIR